MLHYVTWPLTFAQRYTANGGSYCSKIGAYGTGVITFVEILSVS